MVIYTWLTLELEVPNDSIGSTKPRNARVARLIAKRLKRCGSTFKQVALAPLTQKECHPVRFAEAKPTAIGIGTVNTQRNWAGAVRMVVCIIFCKPRLKGSKKTLQIIPG
jgi:hypothetical protein